ncbi:ppsC, partial [Symbiodinium microadriaticum]
MQAHWATNEAVSTSGDGAVFYWNLQTGAGTEMPPPEGHPRSSIRTLACDWAGKRAITGNDDGYFVMWDLEEQIGQRTLNCKVGMILSLYPDWNKMRILVGHGDSDLDLLSMNDGARIKAYPI